LDFEKYEVVDEIQDEVQKKGIVKVIQKGYKNNRKIIRPAKVQVNG
jgi:molecular chaperone GrpE (heat shock protein)